MERVDELKEYIKLNQLKKVLFGGYSKEDVQAKLDMIYTMVEKSAQEREEKEAAMLAEFEEKLKALPLTNKDARKFVRFFLAGAGNVEVDKQGRILIPSNLREFATLEKDVVLVGVGSRIEIWSKEKWDSEASFDDEDMEDIAEHMSDLGLGI